MLSRLSSPRVETTHGFAGALSMQLGVFLHDALVSLTRASEHKVSLLFVVLAALVLLASPAGASRLHADRVLVGEFVSALAVGTDGLPVHSSPLLSHVPHVVAVGSSEEVRGIHATRVVAVMADEHAVWNSEAVQLKAEAMRVRFSRSADAQHAVSSRQLASRPLPTAIRRGFVHALPEPHFRSGDRARSGLRHMVEDNTFTLTFRGVNA